MGPSNVCLCTNLSDFLCIYFLQSGNQEIDINDADRDNPFDELDNIHKNRMPADRDAFGNDDNEPDVHTPVPGSDDEMNGNPMQSSSNSALEISLDNLRECQDFIDFIKTRDGHRVRSMVYTDGTYRYGHLPMSLAICDPMVWIWCSDWPSWTIFYG